MDPNTLSSNLNRLLKEAEDKCLTCSLPTPVPESHINFASSLPLAHAMPSGTFIKMAENQFGIGWRLLSPEKLVEKGVFLSRPNSAEAVLGTTQFVFLYCGQMRYPETQVGFLFSRSLEDDYSTNSHASPFDSGALHKKVTWPNIHESATDFLKRHTLPVPAYRNYLASCLYLLFDKYTDYISPKMFPKRNQDLLGLASRPPLLADERLWSFEVRLRDQVPISEPHLMALFYSSNLVRDEKVRNFLLHQPETVHVEEFLPEDEGDFATLQRQCETFLLNNIYGNTTDSTR